MKHFQGREEQEEEHDLLNVGTLGRVLHVRVSEEEENKTDADNTHAHATLEDRLVHQDEIILGEVGIQCLNTGETFGRKQCSDRTVAVP